MYAIDLSGQPLILGRRIDGILGHDFIATYVTEIDYDARVVRLFEPSRFQYAGSGDTIPIEMRRGLPFATALISVQGQAPAARRLLIDTGSEDAVDDSVVLSSTGPKRRLLGGVGLGQQYEVTFGLLKTVQFGKTVLRDVPSVAGNVALIGSAVLSRFRLTFDYAKGRLYTEPLPRYFGGFALPDGIGVEIAADSSGALRVSMVEKDSPAEKSGIQVGDLIIAMDGTRVERFGLQRAARLFDRPGLAIRLSLVRRGKRVDVILADRS